MERVLTLTDEVTAVPGVGRTLAARLAEHFAITTVGDLLGHLPAQEPGKYRERAEVKPLREAKIGESVTVVASIRGWHHARPHQARGKGPRHVDRATLVDDAGDRIVAPFFNQPWLPQRHPRGSRVAVTGRLQRYRGDLQLGSAQVRALDDGEPFAEPAPDTPAALAEGLVPTYPTVAAVPAERIAGAIRAALEHLPPLSDPLPETLRATRGLVDRDTAVRHIHAPPDGEAVRHARTRLVYDELLALQLGLKQRRAARSGEAAGLAHPPREHGVAPALIDVLPFPLTGAQQRALDELGDDLAGPGPMQRLLQGDVGSGKTIVAAWAMLVAVDHGRQAALMAPTEVLAEQHHRTLTDLMAPLGVNAPGGPRVELITGSLSTRELRRVLADVAAGDVDVLIGTHALLEDRVCPPDLGAVVVDEQHRFGVEHRARLRGKRSDGRHPDVLVMTATPIPRSLALTLYGDLDVTALDELPPGRQPVTTRVVPANSPRRARVEAFVRERAAAGERAYVVCPAVDDSEVLTITDPGGHERPLASAESTYARLAAGPFADLDVGLVHARLPAAERERVMHAFRRGEVQVLVATTVVEVGVDVPEASVMVVEDADRFGLSQLHQLRGRVGRGAARSYCVLFAATPGNARLAAMEATTDGFELAETDLELRGEGSLFDTRQSGLPDLQLTRLVDDAELVTATRHDARVLLEADPDLADHPELRAEVAARYGADRLSALDSG